MSGTSLDGVDAALVEIDGDYPNLRVVPGPWMTYPYPDGLRSRILEVSHVGSGDVTRICRLNFEIGELLADAVLGLSRDADFPLNEVDLISSHGQTIHHVPPSGREPGSTLQIGEPSIIAERTGITTVADFRPRDIAAGGQGAPLVPMADTLLFRKSGETRVVQNIGGIANLTVVAGGSDIEGVVAFDTGPGNMVVDQLMERYTNGEMHYDHDAVWALSGRVSRALLDELLRDSYFELDPPKSTGRERYGSAFTERVMKKANDMGLDPKDIVATVTMLTVESIARAYEKWVIPRFGLDEVILGGGGTLNPAMVQWLKKRLPGVRVTDHAAHGIPNEAKEAIAFAILGYLAVKGVPNNLPSATGARRPVVMGKIMPGQNGWPCNA